MSLEPDERADLPVRLVWKRDEGNLALDESHNTAWISVISVYQLHLTSHREPARTSESQKQQLNLLS